MFPAECIGSVGSCPQPRPAPFSPTSPYKTADPTRLASPSSCTSVQGAVRQRAGGGCQGACTLISSTPLFPAQVYKALYDDVQVVAVKVLSGMSDPAALEAVLREVRGWGWGWVGGGGPKG